MDVEIREEPMTALADYARVPIAFEVERVFEVTVRDDSHAVLSERVLDVPYVKNYDAGDGEGIGTWVTNFNLANWGFLAAHSGGRRVGGAVVAFDTPGVDMLEGRTDLAVLWDLRVAPDARGAGVGSALFAAAEQWAIARGCRELKVETQNINVPACRFYERQGFVIGSVNRNAYPQHPDEVQILWYKKTGLRP